MKKKREENKDDSIDFKKFAQSGLPIDALVYKMANVIQKQKAVIGFLAFLLFMNFILDMFQW